MTLLEAKIKRKLKIALACICSIGFILSGGILIIYVNIDSTWDSKSLIWLNAGEANTVYGNNEETQKYIYDKCSEWSESLNSFIIFTEYDKWKHSDEAIVNNAYVSTFSEAFLILDNLIPNELELNRCNSFIRNYVKVQAYYDVMSILDPECEDYYMILYHLQRDMMPFYPYVLNNFYRFIYHNWVYLFGLSVIILSLGFGALIGKIIRDIAHEVRESKRGTF